MGTYAIKRTLLMIPTFLAVSLIVFLVLNFAPGNPAAAAMVAGDAQSGQSSQLSGQQRESYRLFKEQFNYDKPILFNTRFGLDTDRIRSSLRQLLELDGEVSTGKRIALMEDLENWGWYAIPALIDLLQNDAEPQVRALASQRLTTHAQRSLLNPTGRALTDTERETNRVRATENTEVLTWRYVASDDAARVAEVTAFWVQWHADRADQWDYSGKDKAAIFFLDTRFAKYWGNLIRLDFGISHRDKQPVIKTVFSKLRYSITLAFTAVILAYLVSVPLGVWSSVNRNSNTDRVLTTVLFMLYSLPTFFTGVVLLNFLSQGNPFQVFPTSGFESLDTSQMTTLEYMKDVAWHVVLPIFCMAYGSLAALSRYARTGMLDVIRSDYVRTARAKGLPEVVVIVKHAARNGMIPIITLLATLLPVLISGSVVVEVVFGVPGMGRYMFDSIIGRDYNAVMAVLLISCVLTLVGMLLTDLAYALVDPRITFD
ncbi:MAG: ABC transporter permease [Proteobacteria bacterium]|nr:ABC transporter permease [Pseudomonadota bacterium]